MSAWLSDHSGSSDDVAQNVSGGHGGLGDSSLAAHASANDDRGASSSSPNGEEVIMPTSPDFGSDEGIDDDLDLDRERYLSVLHFPQHIDFLDRSSVNSSYQKRTVKPVKNKLQF
jgi:hypothetical protein